MVLSIDVFLPNVKCSRSTFVEVVIMLLDYFDFLLQVAVCWAIYNRFSAAEQAQNVLF